MFDQNAAIHDHIDALCPRPLRRLLVWSLEASFVDLNDEKSYETCLVARRQRPT